MYAESFFWKLESICAEYIPPKRIYNPCDHFFLCLPFMEIPILQPSKEYVFFDEHTNTSYAGLKQSFWTYWNNTPVCIVDNHQKVLPFISEFSYSTQHPTHLVHIDAHRDDALFPYPIEAHDTPESITHQCRVSDYLDAGKKINTIKNINSYTQSFEFDTFFIPENPFILNLDIDIYGEEGSMVSLEKKTQCILDSWYTASAICIATSPGFIDQSVAFRIITLFLSH